VTQAFGWIEQIKIVEKQRYLFAPDGQMYKGITQSCKQRLP